MYAELLVEQALARVANSVDRVLVRSQQAVVTGETSNNEGEVVPDEPTSIITAALTPDDTSPTPEQEEELLRSDISLLPYL